MGEYMIKVNQNNIEVFTGRRRLIVDLELQGKAIGYDAETNRRYSLTLKNGVVVATEINEQI